MTNPHDLLTTRLEISQGHVQTRYHSIWYGFLLVFYSNFVPKRYSTVTLKTGLGVTQGRGILKGGARGLAHSNGCMKVHN